MAQAIKQILVIGGTHGVEPQSTYVVKNLAKHFNLIEQKIPELNNLFYCYKGQTPSGLQLTMIPDLNRYGLENNTRGNVRGVDLNRNMPATNWSPNCSNQAYSPGIYPASELETQALVKIIEQGNFNLILSLHTNHYVVNPNPPQVNYDGLILSKGHNEAVRLGELLELPVTEDIGYPTPGSLGSYAKEKNIPCITLELDDKYTSEDSWAQYGLTLAKFLDSCML